MVDYSAGCRRNIDYSNDGSELKQKLIDRLKRNLIYNTQSVKEPTGSNGDSTNDKTASSKSYSKSSTKAVTKDKPSYYGHRERVRQRFNRTGIEGLADHEILEMLLFYSIRMIDTKPIAKTLINEFGSLEKVFTASPERIAQVIYSTERPSRLECVNSATLIKFVRGIASVLWRREALSAKVKIANGTELINYLEMEMRDLNEEQLRVIFINNANTIIKDEVLSEGTEDQTAVYPRKIMKRAIELNATGIVVVHNHPAGRLSPSNADINITKSIGDAADTLGVRFIDHLIIGRSENNLETKQSYFSFRENGFL